MPRCVARLLALVAAGAAIGAISPGPVASQRYDATLFHVGGELRGEPARFVGQALVHGFEPAASGDVPIVLYPGLGLSSWIWMATPDGRSGWAQHFALHNHPTYTYDPVQTGPSGIEIGPDGTAPLSTWNIGQIWPRWGFGDRPGEPYSGVRYPVEQIDRLYASWPVRGGGGGRGRGGGGGADVAALEELLERIGPAVLVPHSMGGTTAFEVAARRPDLVLGLVVVEPVGCPDTAEAVEAIADIPFLAVYGDYIDRRRQTGRLEACRTTARLLREGGGVGDVLVLPETGVLGNTHLLMQDDNSLDIADLVLDWIDRSTH